MPNRRSTTATALPPTTEKAFMAQVRDLATTLGWEWYHPFLSIHSPRGWPDAAMCRPPRLIIAELKREDGTTTPSQDRWLYLLGQCATKAWHDADEWNLCADRRAGLEVYLWRPSDLPEIARILR